MVGENAEIGRQPGARRPRRHRLPLPVPQLRRARRQRRPGPARRRDRRARRRRRRQLGFRTIWQAAGHYDHIHIDVANSGAIGVGGGTGGAVGALEEADARGQADRLGRAVPAVRRLRRLASGGVYGGPPDPDVARDHLRRARPRHASPKVRLAAFETAIVESGVHNLNYGDRDSLGVFQQRPSRAGASAAQIMDPLARRGEFIRRAIRQQQRA